MFSLNDKYIAEQQGHWQHAIRQDITHYLWYETVSTFKCSLFLRNSNNKYFLWLSIVSWQITVAPHFKRQVNR